MEFFAICNGIPVHISDSKRGERVLVLLHGYLETLYVWQDFILKLPEDIRTISIDIPGHGLSGTHQTENSLEFCANVVKDVLRVCSVDKATVMGHSMGGYIAIECIKRYPELFNAIVLMFVAFIIVFQDDALHLFGDVLPCTFTEKGSYSVGGAVDLPEEIQRLHIGASAEPRYALLLGH